MSITILMLIYKSTRYLDFVTTSLFDTHSKKQNPKYLIVCNDATQDVIDRALEIRDNRLDKDITIVNHVNNPKDPFWIQNVYNAWNRGLAECDTELLCSVNSDMYFSPGWLDALAKYDTKRYIPTSRLVESERMPSLPGLISKNFGQTLATFDAEAFEKYAEEVKEGGFQVGVGAFGPALFDVERLRAVGGWTKNMGNIPGDQITFRKLKHHQGLDRIMVMDSLAYHFQRGESAEVGDL